MKEYYRISMLSILFTLLVANTAVSEPESMVKVAASKPTQATEFTESKNRIIRFTDKGIVPKSLNLDASDTVVFLLNDSSSNKVRFEIDYGARMTHCASPNLEIEGTIIRSKRPIKPNDFAVICFHDSGTYKYSVNGIGRKAETGSIVVTR